MIPVGGALFLVVVSFATGYACAWVSGEAERRRRP